MASVGHTPSRSGGNGDLIGWSDVPKEEVETELERILESHHFRGSKKCSRFLKHIVQAALTGHFECLKERTIGVDVFDREPQYDTNQDPIVRGTAGEVRKRLAQYYLEEAAAGELRITLPPGSYIPELHSSSQERGHILAPLTAAVPLTGPGIPATVQAAPTPRSNRFVAAGVISCLCIAAGVVVWLFRPTDLDRFWTPVMKDSSVLICVGQPQLYTFRFDTAQGLNSWFTDGLDSHQTPQITTVPLHEIVPMWDKSVALADAQAFSRLVNLFARERKQVDLRGERSVSLSDLRGKPVVLIGAFDNDWTMSMIGEQRFYFATDTATRTQFIRDHKNPSERDWRLVDAWPPGKTIDKDYALVTRVVNRTTERTTIILGGISQYGTEAAAEFVTTPGYFGQALTHAPSDWYHKNIQVVLATSVISGVSGPPSVVATYFW
jgi:hypothetical protein